MKPGKCARVACVWALVFLAAGCPSENSGSTRKAPEVAQAFESLQVFLHYRYFLLNQENHPFGIAGLMRDYRIEGPDWKEINPGSAVFGKVVGLVQRFPAPGGRTEGYYILDRQGNQIGVWYSSLNAGITVDPDTRKVIIATATPWLLK
ncbi:MAG: hypothetical protein ACM3KE_13605 [Hyphomicrobiales bacterium]